MLAENITFLVTFIATSGIALIGIMISYQLFQTDKKNEFQILLYQQIFLFSFFTYSIWGNLAIRQITSGVMMDNVLSEKLAFFIPLLGLPFMMISWFMLLKFGFNLNGRRISKIWMFTYLAGFLAVFSLVVYLFHSGYLETPVTPDNFLLRTFVLLNLFFHLLFLAPFLKPQKKEALHYEKRKMTSCLLIYLGGTGFSSLVLWLTGSFGYAGSAFSLLLMFAASVLLPLCLRYTTPVLVKKEQPASRTFQSFCSEYRISKREAEIVLEICDGKTNKAIAEKLFITLQTVKDHTHRIYTKTQVKSRVQLANLVREKIGRVKKESTH